MGRRMRKGGRWHFARGLALTISIAAGIAAQASAAALSAELIGDLDDRFAPRSSSPRGFALAGGRALFVADAVGSGGELWRTDFTAPGTEMVIDLEPGPESSNIEQLATVGDGAYFVRRPTRGGNLDNRLELWRSDGTAAGTALVAQFPGRYRARLAAAQGRLVAVLYDLYAQTQEIWRSDGTTAGTALVRAAAPFPSDLLEGEVAAVREGDGVAFFFSDDGTSGLELWRSDGTEEGTFALADLTPGAVGSEPFAVVTTAQTVAWLVAPRDGSGVTLWRSDGTRPGTTRAALPAQRTPLAIAALGDVLYAVIADPEGATELWRSIGADGAGEVVGSIARPDFVTAVFDRLLLGVDGGDASPRLFASDGAAELLLLDEQMSPYPPFIAGHQLAYFGAADAAGDRLWRTDGRPQGTFALAPYSIVDFLGVQGDSLIASSYLGDDEYELVVSDGSAAGTTLRNIAVDDVATEGSNASSLTPFRGLVYFGGTDPSAPPEEPGYAVWVTDGTAEGTRPVQAFDDFIRAFFPTDERLYVEASERLWRSNDGVRFDLVPGVTSNPVALGGSLYLLGAQLCLLEPDDTRTCAPEVRNARTLAQWAGHLFAFDDQGDLWVADLSLAGAHVIGRFGNDNHYFHTGFVGLGDRGYFLAAADGEVGLWRTDGTEAGTEIVTVVFRSFGGVDSRIVAGRDRVFFTVDQCLGGTAGLWSSDGTATGTVRLGDVVGVCGATPGPLVARGGVVDFVSADDAHGIELWHSDGSVAGTHLVRDILPGPGWGFPRYLTVIGDRVWFFACSDRGCEPHVSDGTAIGTNAADIAPGAASSWPREFAPLGDRVITVADDGIHGYEPWVITPDEPVCAGDCDGDGLTRIQELVVAVGIGLGTGSAGACATADLDINGTVSIDELIAAVRTALNGCPR